MNDYSKVCVSGTNQRRPNITIKLPKVDRYIKKNKKKENDSLVITATIKRGRIKWKNKKKKKNRCLNYSSMSALYNSFPHVTSISSAISFLLFTFGKVIKLSPRITQAGGSSLSLRYYFDQFW